MTPTEFVTRANQRFADNEFQNITERSFRDFAQDQADTFVAQGPPNIPFYKAGTTYRVDDVVQFTYGPTQLFAAEKDGKLPAPSTPQGDSNWRLTVPIVSEIDFAQGLTVMQAQELAAASKFKVGRLYVLNQRVDRTNAGLYDVRIRALTPNALEPDGWEMQEPPVKVAYDLADDITSPLATADAYTKAQTTTLLAQKASKAGDTFSGDVFSTGAGATGSNATNAARLITYSEFINAINGLNWKNIVRLATQVNVSLSGLPIIDGVQSAVGNRILVRAQSNAAENGIYRIAASGTWARATDADSIVELVSATVRVSQGANSAEKAYTCSVDEGATLGGSALNWLDVSGGSSYNFGPGFTVDGNTVNLTDSPAVSLAFDFKPGQTVAFVSVGSRQLGLLQGMTYVNLKSIEISRVQPTQTTWYDGAPGGPFSMRTSLNEVIRVRVEPTDSNLSTSLVLNT